MPVARREVVVDVPPSVLMTVLTDFGAYPLFLPAMEEASVLARSEDGARASWTVRFAIRIVRRLSYTLRLERDGDLRLRWSLLEGAFRSNDGGWTLEPLDGGSRTRATYEVDLDVGMFVPGSVIKTLVDQDLPRTLAAFKARAEARAGA
jgi:ribosome-associated toxin RatA of RatAB toxin-antitoxin module